jgi:hypothetical protein
VVSIRCERYPNFYEMTTERVPIEVQVKKRVERLSRGSEARDDVDNNGTIDGFRSLLCTVSSRYQGRDGFVGWLFVVGDFLLFVNFSSS